jgi:methylmalonyl-CoA mutase N-terminal domain/subunit
MWAKIMKERFGAKNERTLLQRGGEGAGVDSSNLIVQRPLNNVARGLIGSIAGSLASGRGGGGTPYDEPFGLGWSLEASQLSRDAGRIIQYEAKIGSVTDPLAGSYFIESLTDEIEEAAWKEIEKIDAMGGAVAAVENGYMWREITKSANARQRRIETGEDLVVGVNCFTGENELEVTTSRLVPHPYDPVKREQAEEKQIKSLTELKKSRDNREVGRLLGELKEKAGDENENLMPCFIECVKAYVSVQEMCDVLREVFGEFQPVALW